MIAPVTRSRRTWSVELTTSLTPGRLANTSVGTAAGEAQLHLVVGEVAERVDGVGLDQPAVADDGHPVAGLLDLGQDVARQEDRPARRLRLQHQLEEGLLDERVQARRRLVEDEQVRPVLERDDEADLLLVALGVLLVAPRRVEVEPLDERRLVGRVDAAAQVGEVLDRLGTGQAVVERELTGEVADAAVDRDRVDGRLDAEDDARRRSSAG